MQQHQRRANRAQFLGYAPQRTRPDLGWFTEGFDADLKEAKALLNGVSRSPV
jgi:hypothetical protein